MDALTLRNILFTCLEKGTSELKDQAGQSESTSFFKFTENFKVDVPVNIRDSLHEFLSNEPAISEQFEDGWFFQGNFSVGINIKKLTEWVLNYLFFKNDPDATIKALEIPTSKNKANLSVIYTLQGISVNEPVQITESTHLVPYDHLPDSYQKNQIKNFLKSPDAILFSRNLKPECAIVSKNNLNPFLNSKNQKADDKKKHAKDLIEKTQNELEQMVYLLSVIGPCSPDVLYQWINYSDDTPLGDAAMGLSLRLSEITPHFILSLLKRAHWNFDPVQAKVLINKYGELSEQIQHRLKLPIGRLRNSIKRNYIGDMAIEIGIALEALLLPDTNVELGYRLSQRVAYFFNDDPERRDHVKKVIKTYYRDIRSVAVHGGEIKKVKGIPNRDPMQIQCETIEICADIIKKIIMSGKYPDWDKLYLKE